MKYIIIHILNLMFFVLYAAAIIRPQWIAHIALYGRFRTWTQLSTVEMTDGTTIPGSTLAEDVRRMFTVV